MEGTLLAPGSLFFVSAFLALQVLRLRDIMMHKRKLRATGGADPSSSSRPPNSSLCSPKALAFTRRTAHALQTLVPKFRGGVLPSLMNDPNASESACYVNWLILPKSSTRAPVSAVATQDNSIYIISQEARFFATAHCRLLSRCFWPLSQRVLITSCKRRASCGNNSLQRNTNPWNAEASWYKFAALL